MKVRTLLILTAIASSLLGAIAAYLVLSVPNDLRADALLKQARENMTQGDRARARESLAQIIQKYPRTDAAAAATVALLTLQQHEQEELTRAVAFLRRQNEQQGKTVGELKSGVDALRRAPPPAPVTTTAPPAATKKASPPTKTTKKTTAKKTTAKKTPAKKTTRRK